MTSPTYGTSPTKRRRTKSAMNDLRSALVEIVRERLRHYGAR